MFIGSDVKFFEAWKRAVVLAGIKFFGDGTQAGFDSAQTKWDLCPRFDDINAAMPSMSPGQAIFIGAMYSLYNYRDSRELLSSFGLSSDVGDLTRMDFDRIHAISLLMLSNSGW